MLCYTAICHVNPQTVKLFVQTYMILYDTIYMSLYIYIYIYSDWVCTAVMSNDVLKDLRG